MSRIECETAAQCQELGREMNAVVEPAVTVAFIATVAVVVAYTTYREATRHE